MSFKSREQKRRLKAAENYREKNWQPDPSDYYLTFAKKRSACFHCQDMIEQRDEIAYRHEPREVWHARCAELNGLACRPSRRWRRAREVEQLALESLSHSPIEKGKLK